MTVNFRKERSEIEDRFILPVWCFQFLFLSCSYTCNFLLALATRHPQNFSATEVEGDCTCSQVSPISVTSYKKIISSNILHHCPSDYFFQNLPLATRAALWTHNSCNIGKKCCVASASKNVLHDVAAAIKSIELHRKLVCCWKK